MAEPIGSSRRRARATLPLVLLGIVILLGLGTWQLERRAWKADLIATMNARLALPSVPLLEVFTPGGAVDPASLDFRPARATGRFRHDQEMYLAARGYQGQLGVHVVTPLVMDRSGMTVLVDRGWVPSDRQAPQSRGEGQIDGEVTVEGVLRQPARPSVFTPDNRPDQNLWYWADLPAMAAAAKVAPIAPLLLEAGPAANPGGLPIGGQTRINLPNNHLQYALTWYALALALAVLYLVSRRRKAAGSSSSTHP